MSYQLLKSINTKLQRPVFTTAMIEGWLLPSWFIKQSELLSPGCVLGKYQFVNICFRNWTSFCNHKGEPVLLIDKEGTISFPQIGVSVEVWINDGKKFIVPGRFLRTEQTMDPEYLSIETKSVFNKGICNMRFFPIESLGNIIYIGMELDLFVAEEVAFTNFLICLVVRPYDHNGLTAIRSLEYKNKRMKVNHQEIFQLETEPKIVFCTHAGMGDVTECLKFEHNNYTVTSMDGSCTGLIGYGVRPAERIGIKLLFKPGPFKMFSNVKDFSQIWLFESKKKWINRDIFRHYIITTSTKIDWLFHANLKYLINFNGDVLHPVIYDILVLNRFGFFDKSRFYLSKALKKVRWDGSLPKGHMNPEKLIYALGDYYDFSGDFSLIKSNWQIFKRMGYWLLHNQTLPNGDAYLGHNEDLGWICASLKVLSRLSEIVGDLDGYQFFHQQYQELWSRSLGFFSRKAKNNNISGREIPLSVAIASLAISYPLRLFEKNERFTREWLNRIGESLVFNGGVISPLEFQGVDLELTAHLGNVLLREGWNYDNVFKFLIQTVSSTGCWPDRIHPTFGGGIGDTGHSPQVGCWFLLLLRNIMVMEEGETLYLLPGIFHSKLWTDLNIKLKNFPTTFGEISLTCRSIGEVVEIEFLASFRKKPRRITLVLNKEDRLLYSNSEMVRDGQCIHLGSKLKKIRFRRRQLQACLDNTFV